MYIISLFLLLNVDYDTCLNSLNLTVNMYPHLCFEQKIKKIEFLHLKMIIFTAVKNRSILHRRVIFKLCS